MNITILTNILTPYRIYFFDLLQAELASQGGSLTVLAMVEAEPDRRWSYAEYARGYTHLLEGKTLSVVGTFLHVTKGLEAMLSSSSPDCIVCAGSYLCPPVWQALRYGKSHGCPVYFWSESHLRECKGRSSMAVALREKIRRYIYPRFSGFWVAGRFSTEFVDVYAPANRPRILMPNLVDSSFFGHEEGSWQKAADLLDDAVIKECSSRRVFFAPARLVEEKGICEFIKLLGSCEHKDRCVFLIAGEGHLRQAITETACEYGVRVHLLGQKNAEEIRQLYSIADCFVLPSLSDPNPLSCVEASWAGLPLLLSCHVGNYPELIDAGNNGYVFSYENKSEAVKLIDRLLTCDQEWLDRAGRRSRELAKATYDPETNARRIVNEMASVLGNSK